jgi:predicted dehydrogenase
MSLNRKNDGSSISRRCFLQSSSVAGVAMVGAPSLAATNAVGANDRISIGIIGCGGRGSALMNEIRQSAKKHNCAITSVCDVWQPNLQRAAKSVTSWFDTPPHTTTRFAEVLNRKDIDAVVIATPDFGHCPIMIAALEAGKDVYCEKPMAMEMKNANRALDLARANDRVVQVGTQRRSDGHFSAAAEFLATEQLGTVSRVSVGNFFNEPRWARDYSNCKKQDVDWDAYLFNRPKTDFDPRLLRRWHLFKLCTNGISGLWMAHHIDIIHLLMNSTYPSSAVAHGGTYVWKEDREHCDTFHALLDYPKGYLVDWAMSLGNAQGQHFTVHGTNGTLDLGSWTVQPERRAQRELEQQKITAHPSESHMGNWLACIRSRQRPNADIQYGHQHAAATIMAAAAQETGQRQVYDVEKREIVVK